MRMVTDDDVKAVFNQLYGLPCQRILFTEDGTLILFIGDQMQHNPMKTVWRLFIDCAWKIVEQDKFRIGSYDEPASIDSIVQLLKKTTVTAVTFNTGLGDLDVRFSNNLRLIVFPYSLADEHWQMRCSDGFRMTFGPQAQLFVSQEKPDV